MLILTSQMTTSLTFFVNYQLDVVLITLCLLQGVRPYSQHAALGLQLLTLLGRGHYADTDAYIAHAHLGPTSNCTLLISTQ